MAFVRLSDGSAIQVDDGATPDEIAKSVAQSEAENAVKYGAQARTQNSPVTAGDKVYSASTVYPNSYLGQGMAWLDHNVPGANWVNQNVVNSPVGQTVNQDVMAPLARAESNAVSWPVDLPGAVYNTIKHQTPVGTAYDAPSMSRALRSETGAPELPANASFWRRGAEGALASYLGGGSLFNSVVGGFGGTLGSDIGGYVAGEPGALVGGLVGATGGSPTSKVIAKYVGPKVAAPNAEQTWTSAENIKPMTPGGNFQGLNQPALPGMGDLSQFTPSFTALANPTGQRIATSLSSIPYSGKPIEAASDATRHFVQSARDASANELTTPGGGLPATEPVSASTIADPLRTGSQEAILRIIGEQRARQEIVDTAMRNANVPMGGTVSEGFGQVAGNKRGEAQTDATIDRVGEIQRNAPGGSRYAGPEVPLPAIPTVPWSFSKDWVGDLNASLQSSGRPALPDDIAAALKTVANQERENAANAVQPGLGTQFRQNNESYATAQPILDKLYRMGGEPVGTTGKFADVPREQDIAKQLTGNLQSPEYLTDTLLNPAFPANQRLNAVGQVVSTLGNQGSASNFRPEKFVTDYTGTGGARPTVEALSTGPTGAPLATTNVLDNAAKVAQNYSTPTSRFGLIKSLGSAAAVAKLMELSSRAIEHLAPWKPAQYLGVPQLGRFYSSLLESDALKRAMANQPQNWSSVQGTVPVAGAVTGTNANSRLLAHSLFANRNSGQTP